MWGTGQDPNLLISTWAAQPGTSSQLCSLVVSSEPPGGRGFLQEKREAQGDTAACPSARLGPRMSQLSSEAGISQLPQIISALIEWGPDNVIMHHIPQFI